MVDKARKSIYRCATSLDREVVGCGEGRCRGDVALTAGAGNKGGNEEDVVADKLFSTVGLTDEGAGLGTCLNSIWRCLSISLWP
jgi:hypothetical protein